MHKFYNVFVRFLGALSKALSFYKGSILLLFVRTSRVAFNEGFRGILRRVDILIGTREKTDSLMGTRAIEKADSRLYNFFDKKTEHFFPKISIIVPNYNHARHLKKRLDCIYSQTYSNFEVILLDDCSVDESVCILNDYLNKHRDKTIAYFNKENSGGVFHQWRKGLAAATGELVWIAESDDFCSENFLEELVRFFVNPAVMLAFARTEFVQEDGVKTIWTQEEYLSDILPNIWGTPFIRSASELVHIGWSVKNIIPNVSAALFRKPQEVTLLDDPQWQKLRLCGDWIFYLYIIRGGLVGYSPLTTNYYRQHGTNTSVQAQITNVYYQEHEVVGRYLALYYPLSSVEWELQEKILYNHWCIHHGGKKRDNFLALYSQERIKCFLAQYKRRPHIAIAIFAFSTGGGETFPINLANHLWRRGYTVTVINFQGAKAEDGIRQMLQPSIALINLHNLEQVGSILDDIGVELIHSHHAWVDVNLATFLLSYPSIRHVVTLHGMYEMMEAAQLNKLLPRLEQEVDAFVYTAEKNIKCFPVDFRNKKIFSRIDNALPSTSLGNLKRTDLGLPEDAFVLCMVARAIPEKGWREAVEAVTYANMYSAREIHLLLIGDGDEAEELKKVNEKKFIHFLGFKANVRDYFAVADIGFLPTRFLGESAPLVLIDCLFSGRPMLASAIGEISYMLSSKEGMAGVIFELENGFINIEKLGQLIIQLANDSSLYDTILLHVVDAAKKFDIDLMLDKYEKLYKQVINTNSRGGNERRAAA